MTKKNNKVEVEKTLEYITEIIIDRAVEQTEQELEEDIEPLMRQLFRKLGWLGYTPDEKPWGLVLELNENWKHIDAPQLFSILAQRYRTYRKDRLVAHYTREIIDKAQETLPAVQPDQLSKD